jgi:hypothetical protein
VLAVKLAIYDRNESTGILRHDPMRTDPSAPPRMSSYTFERPMPRV